ncbi:hypothetical protein JZ785_20835 [Alicyclobacillus curvatus]|nr:hypothetical protein JZ785_20835 [Alicyclobacillus curvatus]
MCRSAKAVSSNGPTADRQTMENAEGERYTVTSQQAGQQASQAEGQHGGLGLQVDTPMINLVPSPGFIGRSQHLASIQSWLHQPGAAAQWVYISGIGGMGKTTLMMELAKLCKDMRVYVVWLDGQAFARRPADVLSGIESILLQEYGVTRPAGMSTFDHILAFFNQHRTALFIDNCEDLSSIEGWMLSRFLPQLPKVNFLLMMAGRGPLPITWRTNPVTHGMLRQIVLEVFTATEAKDYLEHHNVPRHLTESLVARAQGHPLSLAVAVDAFQDRTPQNALSIVESIPNLVSAEILKEVTSPSTFMALTALAILGVARFADMQVMHPEFAASDYYDLTRLSFVSTAGQELFMHDIVARALRQDFQARDEQGFRAYCRRAMGHLAHVYKDMDKTAQKRIAAHFLTLYLELSPLQHEYADFSAAPRPAQYRGFQPADLADLHRILQGAMDRSTWQCELIAPASYHALLDEMATVCPEGIRVVRSQTGRPLALGAAIWLRADTLPLLQKYAPRFLEEVLAGEVEALRNLPEEGADSLCMLLSAVDMSHPVYRPETLGMLSFLDWYNVVSTGARCIVASSDAYVIDLSLRFGYEAKQRLAHPRNSGGPGNLGADKDIEVLEWDFRDAKFPVWARTMLEQIDPAGRAATQGVRGVGGVTGPAGAEGANGVGAISGAEGAGGASGTPGSAGTVSVTAARSTVNAGSRAGSAIAAPFTANVGGITGAQTIVEVGGVPDEQTASNAGSWQITAEVDNGQPTANEASARSSKSPNNAAGLRQVTTSMLTASPNPAEVSAILKNLHRAEFLETTNFAREAGLSGFQVQQRVQSLLTCTPPVLPMTSHDQAVLLEAFAQRHVGKAMLAERFNVSRTTFYRYTRSAAINLTQALIASSGNQSL